MDGKQMESGLDHLEAGIAGVEIGEKGKAVDATETTLGNDGKSIEQYQETPRTRILEYQPLEPGDIRLVNFGATGSDPALIHVSLDDEPNFTALSYCWGTENCKHLFDINGQALVLTSSLYDIFKVLQKRGFKGLLWADAVCINQDNLDEKAVQIPLMGRIFGGAEQTIAWLGTSSEAWQLKADAFDVFFRQLVETRYKPPTNTLLDEDLVNELGLPSLNDEIWDALAQTIASHWWTRLWIIQELVLAKQLVLVFEPLTFVFETFVSLVAILNELKMYDIFPTLKRGNYTFVSSAAVHNLGSLRDSFQIHNTRIFEIINLSSRAQVSYKTDSIYGLYSLVNFADMFPLDLSVPAHKLFVRAAKAWRHLEPFSFLLLSLAVERPKITGVPSWVPDFSLRGQPVGLDPYAQRFFAGLATECVEPGVSMHDCEDELLLQGFVLDHVQVVLSLLWPRFQGNASDGARAQARLATIAECEGLIAATYPAIDPSARRMILCRTLCADMPARLRDLKQRCQEIHLGNLDRYEYELQTAALGQKWTMREVTGQNDSMNFAILGRDMISTRRGRIGLATERAQPGDAILVLFGAHVPYVARKKPENGHYELIGDAYIDGEGIMDGEACAKHEREGRPTEHFIFD